MRKLSNIEIKKGGQRDITIIIPGNAICCPPGQSCWLWTSWACAELGLVHLLLVHVIGGHLTPTQRY
jgi:hypothetical protein